MRLYVGIDEPSIGYMIETALDPPATKDVLRIVVGLAHWQRVADIVEVFGGKGGSVAVEPSW